MIQFGKKTDTLFDKEQSKEYHKFNSTYEIKPSQEMIDGQTQESKKGMSDEE